MKKSKVLKVLIISIIMLVIVLLLMICLVKKQGTPLSKEQLHNIQEKLAKSSFLNCVYEKPEEIELYYTMVDGSEETKHTIQDNVEYVYLTLLNEEKLTDKYPEVMGNNSLSEEQKTSKIKEEIQKSIKNDDLFMYQKIPLNTVQDIVLNNTAIEKENVEKLLEKLNKNALYSDTYNCYYLSASTSVIAGNYNLTCINGSVNNNKYTVQYTLELPDTISGNVKFETSFYEENGNYKFISNKCITTEETLEKALSYERSLKDVKQITDLNGVNYEYQETSKEEGQQYYIYGRTCYCILQTMFYEK